MTIDTIFVNRVNVALSGDTALLLIGSPSGPIENGQIGISETLRLVVTHRTLREMAAVLNARIAELDTKFAAAAAEAQAKKVKAAVERRSVNEEEAASPSPPILQ